MNQDQVVGEIELGLGAIRWFRFASLTPAIQTLINEAEWNKEKLKIACDYLEQIKLAMKGNPMVMGFDGYVDEALAIIRAEGKENINGSTSKT